MTDLRKRIEELEEALKYFLDRAWFNLVSDTLPDNHVVSMDARIGDLRRAALLLSEQTETPVEETGDVERGSVSEILYCISGCAHAITEARLKDDPELIRRMTKDILRHVDDGLRAAMRPVSVNEGKLAEIRELIEAGLAGALPYQDESGVVRIKLHPFGKLRRAQEMLSALEGVKG